MTNIPSVIKWTGSKRKQASSIFKLMPSHRRYIEPFLGGGSVLFLAKEKSEINPVCSDIYEPLIELWKLIKTNPYLLTETYSKQWKVLNDELDLIYLTDKAREGKGNIPKTYYDIRSNFNKTPNPLDLNFILRTCVNGIVRFNSNGEFNNSFHLSRRGMKPQTFTKNVMIWHEKVKNVEFMTQDYEKTLHLAKPRDLVYLDPPYLNSKNRYINDLDLERLIINLDLLNKKRVFWALSFDGSRDEANYDHTLPKELYKNVYNLHNGISTMRNTLAKKKEYVTESLYTNF